MLLHVYLMFWGLACVLTFFSFYKRDMILIPFLATAFFFFVGLSSYSIEIPFCESNIQNYINEANPIGFETTFACHEYVKTDVGLGTLAYGLGMMMLIYAIYSSLSQVGEAAIRGAR